MGAGQDGTQSSKASSVDGPPEFSAQSAELPYSQSVPQPQRCTSASKVEYDGVGWPNVPQTSVPVLKE